MLLWSEWRQRRVHFLFCLLWLVGGTCYGIAYELTHPFRTPVASFYSAASLFALFAPIFLAMRTSLGEITDRTKSFSDGVPVSTIRRAWIRLAGGAAVLIVPIVVGAVLISACLAFGWIQQVSVRMPDWVSASERANALPRPSLSAFSATVLVWRVTMIVACSGCFL